MKTAGSVCYDCFRPARGQWGGLNNPRPLTAKTWVAPQSTRYMCPAARSSHPFELINHPPHVIGVLNPDPSLNQETTSTMTLCQNGIFGRLQNIFNYDDAELANIFTAGGLAVTPVQIKDWLKAEEDPGFIRCSDEELSMFLNGLINIDSP